MTIEKTSLVALIATVALLMAGAASAGLLNGGFEDWAGVEVADNWAEYNMNTKWNVDCSKGSTYPVTAHGGNECQRVRLDYDNKPEENGGVRQPFATTAGNTYVVTGWIQAIPTSWPSSPNLVTGKLGVENGALNKWFTPTWSSPVNGTSTWTQVSVQIVATGTDITVFCDALYGYTGTNSTYSCDVFFDDVTVQEVVVPEPGGVIAVLSGLVGLAGLGMRRRR